MPTECRTAARLEGRQYLELAEADMSPMRLSPDLTPGAEDIRDLQGLSRHDPLMWVSAESPEGRSLPAVHRSPPEHRGWWSRACWAEQYLDQADIDLLLQQVCCKRMSEQMH
jgi:hypothetical protein